MIITKCPHCDSTFNVSGEVLLQHNGLVRCSNCSGIFNALQNRVKKVAVDALAATKEKITTNKIASKMVQTTKRLPKEAQDKTKTKIINNEVESEVADNKLNAEANNKNNNINKVEAAENIEHNLNAQQQDINKISLNLPVQTSITDKINKLFGQKFNWRSKKPNIKDLHDNTPLNQRLNEWGSIQKKLPYFKIGIIALGFICTVQILYWQRNNIANNFPSTVPVMKFVSKIFGNKLAPLKLKENPILSFSDMQKDMAFNANRYILNIGLQNKYDTQVAMPNLEISLFDLNEQLITRRVFHPQEFLKPNEWKRLDQDGIRDKEELSVKLRFETNQAISSFKVVVFYP